ncbi:hypothetical protein LWI29_032673 [Acer saccharum]|uniref:Uncharacterized protein n=1 Tax=Acer saccharum TaxID=4024 RepID=A0AA39VKA0_ACESA|nr:hypothetical protein LWI29_032673 [Acer saccharum]
MEISARLHRPPSSTVVLVRRFPASSILLREFKFIAKRVRLHSTPQLLLLLLRAPVPEWNDPKAVFVKSEIKMKMKISGRDIPLMFGWTIFEILRYAPQHNWSAYEEALKTNPVIAIMMISGVVYSLGDWIAQCYEGKPLFEFDRARMFRSSLVGFTLHGSLSHY